MRYSTNQIEIGGIEAFKNMLADAIHEKNDVAHKDEVKRSRSYWAVFPQNDQRYFCNSKIRFD